jgi:hypothetical protein
LLDIIIIKFLLTFTLKVKFHDFFSSAFPYIFIIPAKVHASEHFCCSIPFLTESTPSIKFIQTLGYSNLKAYIISGLNLEASELYFQLDRICQFLIQTLFVLHKAIKLHHHAMSKLPFLSQSYRIHLRILLHNVIFEFDIFSYPHLHHTRPITPSALHS